MILVFGAKLALQVVGQLIPAGALVTVPESGVGILTVNWGDATCLKVADTAVSAFTVTVQAAEPEQAPLQPENE